MREGTPAERCPPAASIAIVSLSTIVFWQSLVVPTRAAASVTVRSRLVVAFTLDRARRLLYRRRRLYIQIAWCVYFSRAHITDDDDKKRCYLLCTCRERRVYSSLTTLSIEYTAEHNQRRPLNSCCGHSSALCALRSADRRIGDRFSADEFQYFALAQSLGGYVRRETAYENVVDDVITTGFSDGRSASSARCTK